MGRPQDSLRLMLPNTSLTTSKTSLQLVILHFGVPGSLPNNTGLRELLVEKGVPLGLGFSPSVHTLLHLAVASLFPHRSLLLTQHSKETWDLEPIFTVSVPCSKHFPFFLFSGLCPWASGPKEGGTGLIPQSDPRHGGSPFLMATELWREVRSAWLRESGPSGHRALSWDLLRRPWELWIFSMYQRCAKSKLGKPKH